MVGDGLSIDPSDALLLAACDGKIVSIHAAGHAVTLQTPEGLELLMHIGIDTVALKGQGFKPRVKAGDRVKMGAPLIEFDLDFLATHAKSVLTQIVVTNSERVLAWERASGLVSAGKDVLFTVDFGTNGATVAAAGATVTSDAIVIPMRPVCTRALRLSWPVWPKAFNPRSGCSWATAKPMPGA